MSVRIESPGPLAFVLSGGASLGAVQVGMLRALCEAGVRPDLIVGTSVGAVNGAYVAQGYDPARIEALAAVWGGIRRRDVFGRLGPTAFLRALFGHGSLASQSGLAALLEAHLPATYQALAIPAVFVAGDAITGRAVLLDRGDLRRQVLASTAIPGVFAPVEVDGQLLVDGGVAANVPLLQALASGAQTLVVLDAGFPCQLTSPPSGLLATWLHTVAVILRHQHLGVLAYVGKTHAVVYLPAPCPLRRFPHDFSGAAELIDAAYAAAADFLDSLRVVAPGVYGHPHVHDATPM